MLVVIYCCYVCVSSEIFSIYVVTFFKHFYNDYFDMNVISVRTYMTLVRTERGFIYHVSEKFVKMPLFNWQGILLCDE